MLHNISGCLQNGECTIWGVQCFILCRHFGAAQMMKTTRHAKLLLVLPPVIGRVRVICCFAWYVSLPNKNATTSTFTASLVSARTNDGTVLRFQYHILCISPVFARSSNEYYSAPEYCSTFKKLVHEDYYLKEVKCQSRIWHSIYRDVGIFVLYPSMLSKQFVLKKRRKK